MKVSRHVEVIYTLDLDVQDAYTLRHLVKYHPGKQHKDDQKNSSWLLRTLDSALEFWAAPNSTIRLMLDEEITLWLMLYLKDPMWDQYDSGASQHKFRERLVTSIKLCDRVAG